MKSWQGVIEPQNKRFLMDDSSPAVLCSSTFTSCTLGTSEPGAVGLPFLPQILADTLTPFNLGANYAYHNTSPLPTQILGPFYGSVLART